MEHTHTPTPWEVYEGHDRQFRGEPYIMRQAGEGRPYVTIAKVYLMPAGFGTSQANAAFIVRACNNYDNLVAACKGIISARNACHEMEAAYVPPEIEAIYKALLEAEGG